MTDKKLTDYISSEDLKVDNKEDYKDFSGLILYYEDSIAGIWFFKDDNLYVKKVLLLLESYCFNFPLKEDSFPINYQKEINKLNEKYQIAKNNSRLDSVESVDSINNIIFGYEMQIIFDRYNFERVRSFKNRIQIINNEEELEK
jgi:hypothetical protein